MELAALMISLITASTLLNATTRHGVGMSCNSDFVCDPSKTIRDAIFYKSLAYPVQGLQPPQFLYGFCHMVSSCGKLASNNRVIKDVVLDLAAVRLGGWGML